MILTIITLNKTNHEVHISYLCTLKRARTPRTITFWDSGIFDILKN
jgi:hypothetical protein